MFEFLSFFRRLRGKWREAPMGALSASRVLADIERPLRRFATVPPQAGEPGSSERGMTLVETLVALAILAGVVLAAYAMTAQSARFAAIEQERLFAGIIADNKMIETLLHVAPPDEGEEQIEIESGGREWIVKSTVSKANDDLLRVVIAVTREGDDQVLARIETLRSGAP